MSVPHQGHIKLARKAFDPHHGDPLWLEPREFSRWEAWIDLLQLAAFKERPHPTKYGVVDLKRGEFVASLRWMAKQWKWTVKKVRAWLGTLQKWARLQPQRETQAGTVYLIVNYDAYQRTAAAEGTAEGTENGTIGAQQGHKKEALKQVKHKNPLSYDSVFEEAWAEYPKRPGNNKAEAWNQWLRRLKDGTDPLDMLEGTRRYRRYVDAQPEEYSRRWVLMARTFFGPARRFADDWTAQSDIPAGPLVDETGVLTAYGRKVMGAKSA